MKSRERKTVALFGGSFNPPHIGHFEAGRYLHDSLHVDEVWFLFSRNWQKDPSIYAPVRDRMAMGEILAGYYPDMPFVMSDIQEQLGTHITYEVLSALKEKFPDTHFIWVMGADNLGTLHTWEHYRELMQQVPIAVMRRPPYTEDALKGVAATEFAGLKVESPDRLIHSERGWCVLDNPGMELSSHHVLDFLHAGKTPNTSEMRDVFRYIKSRGLYGTKPAAMPALRAQ